MLTSSKREKTEATNSRGRGGSPASLASVHQGGRQSKSRPGVDGISNTVHPWFIFGRWMEHVRSRSCEVCTGRDLAVLAGHLAARGSWDSATPEAGSNSAPAALQPPVADVRRSTAPETSPAHCSREACPISAGTLEV